MNDRDLFEDLKQRFDIDNELYAAFCAVEQRWLNGDPALDHASSVDVVRLAWEQLDMNQQHQQMQWLFNAFYHSTQEVRRRIRLDQDGADPSKTYLQPRDLDVIEDTLGGALPIQQFTDQAETSLNDQFPDATVPVDMGVLQRLVSEVELLRHRLDMRDDKRETAG